MELDHESVLRLTRQAGAEWAIERMTFDTTRPNGLAFSLDYSTLYVAQTGRRPEEKRELRAYSLSDHGLVHPPRILHDFGPDRGIDGMCVDNEGAVVATAGWEHGGPGSMIYVFTPDGDVLEQHPLPVRRPTNCAFGGADLSTLFVTTIDGYLLQMSTDRTGRPL